VSGKQRKRQRESHFRFVDLDVNNLIVPFIVQIVPSEWHCALLGRLSELEYLNLKINRAYLLKEAFREFWAYTPYSANIRTDRIILLSNNITHCLKSCSDSEYWNNARQELS